MRDRGKQINIRMNEEEIARAERVAARHGISVASAIRMLLKLEDTENLVRRFHSGLLTMHSKEGNALP